jgi:excisionase family DNA binding protein
VKAISTTASETALAVSIADAARLAGVGRTFLYERIALGELPVRRLGRRVLVLPADLEHWLSALPTTAERGNA